MKFPGLPSRAERPTAARASAATATQAAALLDDAKRLGALGDKTLLGLFHVAAAAPNDVKVLEMIQESLHAYRVREVIAPDPLRPYPGVESDLAGGSVELGTIHETGLPWRMGIDLTPHWLVVGPTGGGKTSHMLGTLEQYAPVLSFLLLTEKIDAGRLLVDPPIVRYALMLEELKLSLFTPPQGIAARDFSRQVIELLCRVWGLQYARADLLEACDYLHDIYEKYSAQQGRTLQFTPRNLLEAVRRRRSKYLDGIVAALEMLLRTTGGILEYGVGFDPAELFFQGPTVLMTPHLHDERVGRFLTDWLMEWALGHLRCNGPNDGRCLFVFAMDDAHRLLSQAAERDGLMPLSHRYLVARQAGMRILAASQMPSDISLAAFSQSGVLVQVGSLMHQRDLQAVGSAMGLPMHAWGRLQTVKRGEFVARENLGRCDRPFGGVLRRFPPPSQVFTEQDRQARMAPILAAWPVQPALALSGVERMVWGSVSGAVPARMPAGLSQTAYALAVDVLAFPWDFLSVRYARMGCAGRVAQQAKDEILQAGWVREHRIPRKGMAPILLEPLAPLWNGLNRPRITWGKGGFLHAFVGECVVKRLKGAHHTRITKEQFFGSKAVDVVALDPAGAWIGVEITMSLGNVVDNVEKDFLVQPCWSQLVLVCRSRAEARQAARALQLAPGVAAYLPRIRVETIADWL